VKTATGCVQTITDVFLSMCSVTVTTIVETTQTNCHRTVSRVVLESSSATIRDAFRDGKNLVYILGAYLRVHIQYIGAAAAEAGARL